MTLPIAIVGIAVELPSGSYSTDNLNHTSFFDFLLNGGEAYERMPSGRFNIDAWKGSNRGEIQVDVGSFLKGIDMFDNVEFGISSRDARAMAPATRKLIENCFLALLDSGIEYRNRNIGCYTSGTSIDLTNVTDPDEHETRGSFAGYPSMVANRISTHLDLLGPSVPIDTACSSTMTALHLAVQGLSQGDCEAAVVAGCQLNHRFIDWVTYSQGSLLSHDGKCKPFDKSADGFGRAEGCVAIVIKPLHCAIRDYDRIYATILSTAINSSGGGAPPGAPVAEAQRDTMINAFKLAGRAPQDVDYVELHATGTAKGDPTEANWLGSEMCREDEILIGSVKGNIGHTEIVAFLASLSKVISIFRSRTIPPNVNLRSLNPEIHWEQYRLRVPLRPTPLPCHAGEKSLISMSSSGIGGSNGHVVLECPPTIVPFGTREADTTRDPILLIAGGLSSRSATAIAQSTAEVALKHSCELSVLSTVLGRRSKQMTWRAYAIVQADLPRSIEFSTPQYCPRVADPIVFVFSGQGPQHNDMGRGLFKAFPVFRNSILEMDLTYKKITKKSVLCDYGLFSGEFKEHSEDVWPISLILPSITMFQIALFDLMISLGIKPDIVLGHSAGETSVLYASGAAPKAMAVELAVLRGLAFSSVEGLGGAMAALACGTAEATQILADTRLQHPGSVVEIACFNSHQAVAIAGHEVAVHQAIEVARERGVFGRKIRTKVPVHSSLMDVCREEYCRGVKDLFSRYPDSHEPKVPTYSTLSGQRFHSSFDADYFWHNTRLPVRFSEAIQALGEARSFTFIEIAPHPVLSSYITSMTSNSSAVLPTVRRPKSNSIPSEHLDILDLCGRLTVKGHSGVNFTVLNGRTCYESEIVLPAYPFTKKRYPLYPDTPGYAKQMAPHQGPLNHGYLKINKDTHPILGEHVIRGEPIMPAAGFLEMAIEFGASTLMNVNLRSILSLSAENPTEVIVTLDNSYWKVVSVIAGTDADPRNVEKLHADGYLSFERTEEVNNVDIPAIRSRCDNYVDSSFYQSLSYFSAYGSRLRRVTNVYYRGNEALVSIKGNDRILAQSGHYVLHPAVLDSCLHITAYRPFNGDFNPNTYYLPARVQTVVIDRYLQEKGLPDHLYAHVLLNEWTPTSMRFDISLIDDVGKRICSLHSLEVVKHYIDPLPDTLRPFDLVYQTTSFPMTSWSSRSVPPDSRSLDAMIRENLNNAELLAEHSCLGPVELRNIQALRIALSALACKETRRIVRLIVEGIGAYHLTCVISILKEFPANFYEIFTAKEDQRDLIAKKLAPGSVRSITMDAVLTGDPLSEPNLYDIALFFDIESMEDHLQAVVLTCNQLLVPGGILVLTKQIDTEGVAAPSTDLANDDFGGPTSLDDFSDTFRGTGMSVLYSAHDQGSSGAALTVTCQKGLNGAHTPETPVVFDEAGSFVFEYRHGNEIDLQWDLSGLATSQHLDIWIIAVEGRDSGSAFGLVRALRRERILWTIRLVIFPDTYTQAMREDRLTNIPISLKNEPEILVSARGDFLVPRMVPLPSLEPRQQIHVATNRTHIIPSNKILVEVCSSWALGICFCVLGSIAKSNSHTLREGDLVIGLVTHAPDEFTVMNMETVSSIPPNVSQYATIVTSNLLGFVVAVLAPGLSTFKRLDRLRSIRILLTHSDTPIGRSIAHLYRSRQVGFMEIQANANLSDLASAGPASFHLVVSGYEDPAHTQIIRTLLRPGRGRVFLWNAPDGGLFDLVQRDPCSVGDALACAVPILGEEIERLHPQALLPAPSPSLMLSPEQHSSHAVLSSDKTYIIIGGIGNLGAHIALFLYEAGARHIVVTSRRGRQGLDGIANPVVGRIFEHLDKADDLQIQLEAVNATSAAGMNHLASSLPSELGGCIILSAVLSDLPFELATSEDFSRVYDAKLGVLSTFLDVFNTSGLEFLVAFTSMSGLFGFGGQTNYGAANTALEEALSSLPYAFSFVCPGILDSSLMLAGRADNNVPHLKHAIEWSISAEEMILWFNDALFRYQHGQRFSRYIPDMDWEAQNRTLGMTKIGQHLVLDQNIQVAPASSDVEIDSIVRSVLNIAASDFSPEAPLTTYGIDSLSAAKLSLLLRPFIEVTQLQLLANTSLADLKRRISAPSSQSNPTTTSDSHFRKEDEVMGCLLAKYTEDLKECVIPSNTAELSPDRVVILTGSTGALGCNILSCLLLDDDVKRVYALNRRSTGGAPLLQRQRAAFSAHGLSESLAMSPKLILLECDLQRPDLGISATFMDLLLTTVTHIIHNAWMVDIYSPLETFEYLIQGTRRLIDLAAQSRLLNRSSFVFISTVGIYQHYHHSSPAPEAPVTDPQIAVESGYTESKWVAERLVQIAAEKLSLNVTVIRTGLLTGSLSGCWDTTHWFPALVQSATYLGCLPDGNGVISWIPVDLAAAAIVDLLNLSKGQTLHLIHPRPVTWTTIIGPLASTLKVPLVPYAEWFARLESIGADEPSAVESLVQEGASRRSRAALGLLYFFRRGIRVPGQFSDPESLGLMPEVTMDNALRACPRLSSMAQLSMSDVHRWLSYWREMGFL